MVEAGWARAGAGLDRVAAAGARAVVDVARAVEAGWARAAAGLAGAAA